LAEIAIVEIEGANLTRIRDEKNIPKLKAKTQKYEFNSSQNK